MTADGGGTARCPWCSAPLPGPAASTCPSCGAGLREVAEAEIPGVTALDPVAIGRVKPPPQRSRLLSWLSGDTEVDEPLRTPAAVSTGLSLAEERASLEPPSAAVRREMLRIEMEALAAEAAANAAAVESDALAEGHPAAMDPAADGATPLEPMMLEPANVDASADAPIPGTPAATASRPRRPKRPAAR